MPLSMRLTVSVQTIELQIKDKNQILEAESCVIDRKLFNPYENLLPHFFMTGSLNPTLQVHKG